MRWKQLPLLLLLSFAGSAAYADTTYNVNLIIGAATANGTITTDGTIGTLSTASILGFDLTFAAGTSSQTILNQSAGVLGSQFTATSDGLFYDFSNTSTANFAGFASNATTNGLSDDLLCFTGGGNCGSSIGQQAVIRVNGVAFTSDEAGTFQVASAAVSPVATPEPSSLALLGTGLLGMYGVARRRFA